LPSTFLPSLLVYCRGLARTLAPDVRKFITIRAGELLFTRPLKLSRPRACDVGCRSGENLDRESVRVRLLALQLPFLKISESMGNHDSKIVDTDSVD
jgi:hypothetical protein